MLKNGILNPNLLALIARVRHTNTVVIADRGFPFWKELETVDLSLVDGIPTVLEVVAALRMHSHYDQAWMAEEFTLNNAPETRLSFDQALHGIPVSYEPHPAFKKLVPSAVGLIRTGDVIPYANLILRSA